MEKVIRSIAIECGPRTSVATSTDPMPISKYADAAKAATGSGPHLDHRLAANSAHPDPAPHPGSRATPDVCTVVQPDTAPAIMLNESSATLSEKSDINS
jgi:hypothetical protein